MFKYVAGLLFSSEGDKVALIHKDRGPEAVVGRWNAIGGKVSVISPGEFEKVYDAMQREFIEEAGVHDIAWVHFLLLKGNNWEVSFFHAFDSKLLSTVRTVEREIVDVFSVQEALFEIDVVPNLRWIIQMALGHEKDHVHVYEVIEKEVF
jgi:8-oxo-dGTP pyrophosphatase MutT (NUDIX family)